jgi:hypothetical protein
MTSALQRGSNLPATVPKTMVIPEERAGDLDRKMKSPLFSEHFHKDHWALLFFDALREAFTKTKAKTELEPLLGLRKEPPARGKSAEPGGAQILMELGAAGTPQALDDASDGDALHRRVKR